MISFKSNAPKAASGVLTLESSSGWWPTARGRDSPMGEREALAISAFYRAVALRSDSIGRLPAVLRDLTTRQELTEHWLGPLLWERPNELMGPFVYKSLVEYRRLVLGNSYVWILRDQHDRPVELLPLPPGGCQPVIAPDTGRLWYVLQDPKSHQLYRVYPTEVLHYKGFSLDGIVGLSLLGQAARTLRVAQSRDIYESDYYANGGRPSGVLKTDTDLSDKTTLRDDDGNLISYKDLIRREWERIYTGPGRSMRTAVLDLGLDYKPIAMSNADAQFVESKGLTVADIARFTGVPLYLLYSGKESYQSNSANATEYVRYTIQPTVTQYEEEDSRKLLTISERRRGLWISRNMMAELRGNIAERRDWYKAMVEAGVFSVNDVRELEDLPDIPGGDLHRASLNYVPLELWEMLTLLRAEADTGRQSEGGGEHSDEQGG